MDNGWIFLQALHNNILVRPMDQCSQSLGDGLTCISSHGLFNSKMSDSNYPLTGSLSETLQWWIRFACAKLFYKCGIDSKALGLTQYSTPGISESALFGSDSSFDVNHNLRYLDTYDKLNNAALINATSLTKKGSTTYTCVVKWCTTWFITQTS